jgi:hypothetical protein
VSESVAFILCTERGPLEQMSALFASSLRRFGGSLSDAPVYSYAPRLGHDVGSRTRKHFARLEVNHQHIPLNTEFKDYPLANKPLVAAYAELNLEADIIVFVDSDMLLFAEPSALMIPEKYDIALRPVDVKGIGVGNDQDREYGYWSHLFRICNVEEIAYVETTVDKKRIYSYWNSGLVASRRRRKIFSLWAENFKNVMRSGITPTRSTFFIEQSSLSASVLAAKANVYQLPNSYNYPIHLHHLMEPSKRIENLREMVTAHYHNIFRRDGKYVSHNPVSSFFNSDEHSTWLIKQLDALGVYPANRWRRLVLSYMDMTKSHLSKMAF